MGNLAKGDQLPLSNRLSTSYHHPISNDCKYIYGRGQVIYRLVFKDSWLIL